MRVVETKKLLQDLLNEQRMLGKSIGFVPTMGALHMGHTALVEKAVSENDVVIVSIFVNPTQFNNPNDLKTYPRMLEEDLRKCEQAGANIIFVPTVEEIYPEPDTRIFDFGMLDKVMEGKHRPGHFNGVAQVVSKLFDIVKPHRAYFGQKDFQQLAVIKKMVSMLGLDIQIVVHPTVREADGLAMSSRNMLLDPDQRKSAPLIAKTLHAACSKKNKMSVQQMIDWVVEEINRDKQLNVEYFEIANADTLQSVHGWNECERLVACIAVQVGKVRLIDNILL